VAARAGDLATGQAAIEALVAAVAVDPHEEGSRFWTAAQITTVDGSQVAVDALLAATAAAVRDDAYGPAVKLAALADQWAKRAKLAESMPRTKAALDDAKELAAEFGKIRIESMLGEIRPEEHLALGRFRCFLKGDWAKGIPDLVAGGDPGLNALAEADLKAQADAALAEAAADGWAEWARKQPAKPRGQAMARAVWLYRSAVETASGVARLRIEKRLAEAEKLAGGAVRGSGIAMPSGLAVWLDGTAGADGKPLADAGPGRLALAIEGKVEVVPGANGGVMRLPAGTSITAKLKAPLPVEGSFTAAFWYRAPKGAPPDGAALAFSPVGSVTIRRWGAVGEFVGVGKWFPQFMFKGYDRDKGDRNDLGWMHIAMVCDLAGRKLGWHLDGEPVGRQDVIPFAALPKPIDAIVVGKEASGEYAHLAFWSRVLKAEELKAVYEATKAGRR
jgi:hypothetical protein